MNMNQILIGNTQQKVGPQTFFIKFSDADKHLQILRSDHFISVEIALPQNISDHQLRFLMHLSRITKPKALIKLSNQFDSSATQAFKKIALKLGFYLQSTDQNKIVFYKQKPNEAQIQPQKQTKKLSIGFKSNQLDQIDEEEMMKNETIKIDKPKVQNCADKPKACANCNCGRKDNPLSLVPKQKLVESINEGKPVSGCGKCFLGDSFRCGSCPYKGLPAFKAGDKLKLVEEGQVIVETNYVKVQSGKVKIEL